MFTFVCSITGTFDLTIDGHTYAKIDVHSSSSALLEIVRQGGEYNRIHKWGNCYGEGSP